jgi:hypothetical protein
MDLWGVVNGLDCLKYEVGVERKVGSWLLRLGCGVLVLMLERGGERGRGGEGEREGGREKERKREKG